MPLKISQLTTVNNLDSGDIFPVVDYTAGNGETKKIDASNLAASLAAIGGLAKITDLNSAVSRSLEINTSGWIKIKDVIIQWGLNTPNSREYPVTLPLAWPNKFLTGFSSIGAVLDANFAHSWGIYPSTTNPKSQIILMNYLRSAATTYVAKPMYWLAIGY